MLGVVLARLGGVVVGVRGVAMRRVRVMTGLLVALVFVMLGRFAMVFGGELMMLGGFAMMLDDLVFGHSALRQ
jgi:hypothetical protein